MNTSYGSTKYKMSGISNQQKVIEKVIHLLTIKGYVVSYQKASKDDDMNKKIDYYLHFDPLTPFLNKLIVAIDVKYGTTYTVIDQLGHDSLDKSEARWLIFNNPKNEKELLWVSVTKLKKCRELYPFDLIDSYEEGNTSKFMRMFSYVEQHQDFFGKGAKIYNI